MISQTAYTAFQDEAEPDIPLAMWSSPNTRASLMTALVSQFSRRGDLVATTLWRDWGELLRYGRQALAWCHPAELPQAEAMAAQLPAAQRGHGHVESATDENLSVKLIHLDGSIDLLICNQDANLCEGFWSAASRALHRKGTLAVIFDPTNAEADTQIIHNAGGARLHCIEHIETQDISEFSHSTQTKPINKLDNVFENTFRRDVVLFRKCAIENQSLHANN